MIVHKIKLKGNGYILNGQNTSPQNLSTVRRFLVLAHVRNAGAHDQFLHDFPLSQKVYVCTAYAARRRSDECRLLTVRASVLNLL